MGMKFYTTGCDYPNEVTFTLDAGTEHASYDLDNLVSRVRRKQFRTANGSATDIYIEFDYGTGYSPNYVLCDGFLAATGLTVQTGSTDNGSTWDETRLSDTLGGQSDETIELSGSWGSISKRYWRLRLNGFAANAVNWLNNLWLVTEYETPVNSNMPVQIGYTYDNVFRLNTIQYERRYKISERRRVIRGLNLKHFSEAQMNTFIAEFEDNCKGTLKPFYFLDDDGSTYFYGSFIDQEFVFNKESNDNYSLTFGIIEQL